MPSFSYADISTYYAVLQSYPKPQSYGRLFSLNHNSSIDAAAQDSENLNSLKLYVFQQT